MCTLNRVYSKKAILFLFFSHINIVLFKRHRTYVDLTFQFSLRFFFSLSFSFSSIVARLSTSNALYRFSNKITTKKSKKNARERERERQNAKASIIISLTIQLNPADDDYTRTATIESNRRRSDSFYETKRPGYSLLYFSLMSYPFI